VWSPPKARLTAPIKRRLNNTQLPANCCGRKAQLDGKFSALCGFGIKPGYRSRQRDLGVLGNNPAVQNMLLASRAPGLGATLTTLYLNFEKEAEAAFGLPPRRPLLCPAADRLPHGPVRSSSPCSAGRCRLRRPMGPALPGSVAICLSSPADAYPAGAVGSHR
jgi:nitroreductase